MKNLIKNNSKAAHNNYFSRIFDTSTGGNRCQFWKYIRAKHKDNNEISTLKVMVSASQILKVKLMP